MFDPIRKDSSGKKLPEYEAWVHMRSRCLNKNNAKYHRYGGRGIKICWQWLSFEIFLRDMGPRPGPEYSLHRIDNDKDYELGNCKWALLKEQLDNKSLYTNNRTGITGVCVSAPRGRFRHYWAYWSLKGRIQTLYTGLDFFEACCARKSWEVNCKGVTA